MCVCVYVYDTLFINTRIIGTADQVLPFEVGKMAEASLRTMGYSVDFRAYPGMGHSASTKVLCCFIMFILLYKLFLLIHYIYM